MNQRTRSAVNGAVEAWTNARQLGDELGLTDEGMGLTVTVGNNRGCEMAFLAMTDLGKAPKRKAADTVYKMLKEIRGDGKQ